MGLSGMLVSLLLHACIVHAPSEPVHVAVLVRYRGYVHENPRQRDHTPNCGRTVLLRTTLQPTVANWRVPIINPNAYQQSFTASQQSHVRVN